MAAEISSPASYAARLSAMGGETRRSSFGAPKLTLEELEEEGGVIDKVLAFSQPSQIDMYNPWGHLSFGSGVGLNPSIHLYFCEA